MKLTLTVVTLVICATVLGAAPGTPPAKAPAEVPAKQPVKKPVKAPGWECHGPWGGLVLRALVDPGKASRVLVETSRGWFLSVDAGDSWRLVRHPGGASEWVPHMAFRGDRLVVVQPGSVLTSRDGLAWQQKPGGPGDPMSLAAAPGDDRLWGCFMSRGEGTRRTVSVAVFDGDEWRTSTLLGGDGPDRSSGRWAGEMIAVHPEQPDIVRVFVPTFRSGAGADVLATDDGGKTWKTWAISFIPSSALFLHGSPDRLLMADVGSGLLLSEDGGRTWSSFGEDPRVKRLRTIARAPGSPRVWIATQERGLLWTDDEGKTLARAGKGIRNTCVTAIAAAKSDPKTVYAGTQWGAFRSTDEGETWTDVTKGVAGGQNQGPLVFRGPPERVVMFDWMCGMRVSTDGARTWSELDPDFFGRLGRFFKVRRSGRTILATSWKPGEYVLWVSRDAGVSWTRATVEEGQALAVLSESEMYATPDGKELVRSDTGGIWESLGRPLADPNARITWVGGRADGDDLLVCSSDTLVRCDRKTGEVRETLGLPPGGGRKMCILDPNDEKALYISTRGEETWRGDPAIGTWKAIAGGLGYLLGVVVDPRNAGRRIAGYESGALRLSEDGGKTWRPLTPDPGFRFLRGLDVTTDRVLLVAADGAVHRIPLASIR